jgi:chromosome segregation ATPase
LNPQAVFIVFSVVATVSAALGIAYAVSKSNAVTTAIQLYKETNQALEARLNLTKSELDEARQKIAKLEETVTVLRDTVTGAAIVNELGRDIAREERARQREHKEQREILETIQKVLLQLVRDFKGGTGPATRS